jgi:hypothetical protein
MHVLGLPPAAVQGPITPAAFVFPLAPVIPRVVKAVVPRPSCISPVIALATPSVRLATRVMLPDRFTIAPVVGGT